ncbi:MAG: pilus assembly protein PilM [Verrucomicrobia bacterium]|nr:pilus assembly protein PilM [Verrucomicrobiota bacterium]
MRSIVAAFRLPWPFARICAVDLGASRATAAVFRYGSRRLRCLRFVTVDFREFPETDGAWATAAGGAFSEVVRRLGYRGPAVLALAPHLVLTKHATTPAVNSEQREKVVHFEATQAVPLALEDMVWDCVGDFDARPDWRLTFSVAKREVIEVVAAAAKQAGLAVRAVFPAGRALAADWGAAEGSLPPAVIQVGARSTTVLVRSAGDYRERSIAVGGHAVVAALAEELGVPVTEAGRRLPAHEAILAAPIDRLAAALVLESGQFEGIHSREEQADDRVVLTGEYATLPGLAPRIAAYLGLRVDSPASAGMTSTGSAPGREEELARTRDQLRVVSGLVRLYRGPGHDGGLLPEQLRAEFRAARQFRRQLLMGVLPVAALLPPCVHYATVTRLASQRAEMLSAQRRELERCVELNAAILPRIWNERSQAKEYCGLLERRGRWIGILRDLQQCLAADEAAWLERMECTSQTGTKQSRPTLRVHGRILDLADPVGPATPELGDRARRILDQIRGCSWVERMEDERFNLTEPGTLRFEATLVVAPICEEATIP